jgi:hypothetical protein
METGNGSIGGCKRLMHDSKPSIARGNESLSIPHALISVGKVLISETNE